MRRTVMLALTLAVGIALGMVGSPVLNAQLQPVRLRELLRTDLRGIEGKEGIVVLTEIAPGAAGRKHYHPGHEFTYVLEGSYIEQSDGKSVTRKVGDVVYTPPRQVGRLTNASTTDPVKILVFFVHEKGQPLAVTVE